MTAPPRDPIEAPGTREERWLAWGGLAQLPAADISGWSRAVIVAAHPDDEVLGVGGTMAALAVAGARLRLVAITDGEASHPNTTGSSALARRRVAETAEALHMLGARHAEVIRLGLPDTALAAREDEIAARLTDLITGFDACLAPWARDVHADHEAAGRAARRASERTLSYPVWMWHWAVPGDSRVPWHRAQRVNLTAAVAARKRAGIACFTSQLESRGGALGPVLSPGTVAHFTRDMEVLFR